MERLIAAVMAAAVLVYGIQLLDEFRKLRDGKRGTFRLSIMIQWARSHRNYIKAAGAKDLDHDELLALRELAADTVRVIDERLKS